MEYSLKLSSWGSCFHTLLALNIRKGHCPIQCFIWKCYLHSLPVKELLVARGIAENGVCKYCGLGSESILHVLRDCPFAKKIWANLDNTRCDEDFFSSGLCGWLKRNLKDSKDWVAGQSPWDVQFAFGIWSLWTHRNKRIFKHEFSETFVQWLIVRTEVSQSHTYSKPTFLQTSFAYYDKIKRISLNIRYVDWILSLKFFDINNKN